MKPLRVLIVDDSAVMRKIVERTLRGAGVAINKVFEAGDGEAGLTVMRDNSIDLVLSDINMPKMNGLEFVKHLRAGEGPKVPIVMITTEGGEGGVLEAISHGANGYIRKPFTPDQIEAQLKRIFEATN